jgi:epoxyqueuosine reductase
LCFEKRYTCSMTLTHRLKAEAHRLGFHAVGVASAQVIKESGLNPGFGRKSSCAFPEDAMSVVSVALSYYYRPTDAIKVSGPSGRVARFAWGQDYHRVLGVRLQALADWLREESGCDSAICVDTGPLTDRVAAPAAGIGHYGKNCVIIVPGRGSWVCLGELVTSVELEVDSPSDTDHCGSCSLCMDACPTGAITAPHKIDMTRCVSLLTQKSGYAPRELRPAIGDRVFGCDACQDACPQNRSAAQTDVEEFLRFTPPGRSLSLISVLRMTPEEHEAQISGNSMAWIGLTRLRRNAAIALGNSGDPASVPALIEALSDKEPLVRGHAAWALGRIGDEQGLSAVKKALASETDTDARAEMEAVCE